VHSKILHFIKPNNVDIINILNLCDNTNKSRKDSS